MPSSLRDSGNFVKTLNILMKLILNCPLAHAITYTYSCYCGQNIYILFRFRKFHHNMSKRRANMLNIFLDTDAQVMAAGRRFLRSTISLFVYVFLCLYKVSFTSYSQLSADLDSRITFHGYLQSPKRNISFSTWTFQPRGRRYLSARILL